MACDLTQVRAWFVDFGDLGTVTKTDDEITDLSGTFQAYQYDLKGTNSLETAITSSRENGTTFFEETLTLTLPKLSKEDNKELKLMAYGRPHIVVEDRNGNCMLAGLEHGMDVTGGTIATGTTFGDMSGYTLTLTGQELEPANFIAGAVAGNPFATAATGATIVLGTNS
jgi:hypothetical protein